MKMLSNVKNLKAKVLVGTGVLLTGSSAMAAPVDFSTLTTAADFSTAVTSVLLVGANVMLVYIAIKGFRLITNAIKG